MHRSKHKVGQMPEIEELIESARLLNLSQLRVGKFEPHPVNRPTLEMIRHFFEVLHSGESLVLVQWPMFQRDVSMMHSLAMLASIAPRNIQNLGRYTVCDSANSFRTLFFPWIAGRTRTLQQSLLVKRQEVLKWNQFHLTRLELNTKTAEKTSGEDLRPFHITFGHLQVLASRDESKPHLAHPSLAEIYPMFTLEVDESTNKPKVSKIRQMLERLDFGASLSKLKDDRPELENPIKSPFGLFGVSIKNEMRRILAAKAISCNPPSICILDLNSNTVRRLGQDWSDIVSEFLKECKKRFEKIPFYGLTNDLFIQQSVAKMLKRTMGSSSPRNSITIRFSNDPIADDSAFCIKTKFKPEFHVVSGELSKTMSLFSDVAKSLQNVGFAGSIRRSIGTVRAAASLPYGKSKSYEILCESFGQAKAEGYLENKSGATVLNILNDALNSEIGGNQKVKVNQAYQAVKSFFQQLEKETPIGFMMEDLIGKLDLKSGRTIIAFNSEFAEKLGTHRLCNCQKYGAEVEKHFETGQLRCVNEQSLDSLLRELEEDSIKNSWKRLLIVAPSMNWLAKIVTKPMLPCQVVILCDRNFAYRVAKEYEKLAQFEELSDQEILVARFTDIYTAAIAEFNARESEALDLELEANRAIEKNERVIDLTDDEQNRDSDIVEIMLESGRILLTGLSSKLIRVNQNLETEKLEKVNAQNINEHDIIVVPDRNFISQAREILPIEVLAGNLVDYYHERIGIQLPNISGNTIAEKARYIFGEIQSKGATVTNEATVVNWINVERHRQTGPEVRRANAPQNWQTFFAFMSVLGVEADTTEGIWVQGIQPFRADRRRAGQKMANAFISILIDPYGSAFNFGEEIRTKILQLQESVLDCTDQVAEICFKGLQND